MMNYRFFSQVLTASLVAVLGAMSPATAYAADVTFTAPAPLTSYAAVDGGAGNQVNPKIASDGNQTLVAAWSSGTLDDPNISNNNVIAAVSEDNGVTWSEPETIFSGEATLALMAHTESDWVAMWYNVTPYTNSTSRSLNLFCARSTDGRSWAEPEQIYSGSEFFKDTESDGENTIIVLLGSQMLRSIDGGLNWSSVLLADQASSLYYLDSYQIASGGGGKWYLLTDTLSGTSNLSTSTDNGATWSEPVPAQVSVTIVGHSTFDIPVKAQELAARDNTIVATSYPGIVTSIDGGATWTTDVRPDDVPLFYDFPVPQDVEVDSDGNWIMVTEEFRNPPLDNFSVPNPGDHYVTISTSSDPAAGWTEPVDVSTSGTRTENPAVQPLGDGGFAVVYQSYSKDEDALMTDADIAVTVKADAGSSWTQPVQVNPAGVIEFPYIDDNNVLLEIGDNGTVLAVWEANSDQVMFARSTNYGINWSDSVGVNSLAESGSVYDLHVVYAGTSRWLISYGTADGYEYVISNDDGLTWSAPADLDQTPSDVAANGNGTIVKFTQAWSWDSPTDITLGPKSLSRLPRNSHTWEEPFVLPESDLQGFVVLLANTSGQNWCLIVGGEPFKVYTSTDDGRTWAIQSGTNLPRSARFDIDDNGNIVAIDAREKSAFDASIYVSRSTNNGVDWSTPVFLAKVPTGDIVVRPEFIYGDIVHFGSSIWVIGLNTSQYALSGDGGATWSGLAPFPFGEIGIKSRPAMTAKDNRILFAWQQDEKDVRYGDSDIYYSLGSYGVQTAAQDWQLYE